MNQERTLPDEFERLLELRHAPSSEIREALRGKTVLLAFSRGKDSVLAWLKLREAGVNVIPLHFSKIPGLTFEHDSLEYFTDYFDQYIYNLMHPGFWDWLANGLMQTPFSRKTALNVGIPKKHSLIDLDTYIGRKLGLENIIIVEGVRASDSTIRRFAQNKYGAVRVSGDILRVHAVWDAKISDVRDELTRHNCLLPRFEYQTMGRTFDSLKKDHLGPIRSFRPEDWATVKFWFPNVDQALWRHQLKGDQQLKKIEAKELTPEQILESIKMPDSDQLAEIDIDAIIAKTQEPPEKVKPEKLPHLEEHQEKILTGISKALNQQSEAQASMFDGEYATQIVFQTRAQREAFVQATGWETKQKYIDGLALARTLGIDIGPPVKVTDTKPPKSIPNRLLQPEKRHPTWKPIG